MEISHALDQTPGDTVTLTFVLVQEVLYPLD
jgi:hypothetical protein